MLRTKKWSLPGVEKHYEIDTNKIIILNGEIYLKEKCGCCGAKYRHGFKCEYCGEER